MNGYRFENKIAGYRILENDPLPIPGRRQFGQRGDLEDPAAFPGKGYLRRRGGGAVHILREENRSLPGGLRTYGPIDCGVLLGVSEPDPDRFGIFTPVETVENLTRPGPARDEETQEQKEEKRF
mgnify:CR=1 FL=1